MEEDISRFPLKESIRNICRLYEKSLREPQSLEVEQQLVEPYASGTAKKKEKRCDGEILCPKLEERIQWTIETSLDAHLKKCTTAWNDYAARMLLMVPLDKSLFSKSPDESHPASMTCNMLGLAPSMNCPPTPGLAVYPPPQPENPACKLHDGVTMNPIRPPPGRLAASARNLSDVVNNYGRPQQPQNSANLVPPSRKSCDFVASSLPAPLQEGPVPSPWGVPGAEAGAICSQAGGACKLCDEAKTLCTDTIVECCDRWSKSLENFIKDADAMLRKFCEIQPYRCNSSESKANDVSSLRVSNDELDDERPSESKAKRVSFASAMMGCIDSTDAHTLVVANSVCSNQSVCLDHRTDAAGVSLETEGDDVDDHNKDHESDLTGHKQVIK